MECAVQLPAFDCDRKCFDTGTVHDRGHEAFATQTARRATAALLTLDGVQRDQIHDDSPYKYKLRVTSTNFAVYGDA